MFSMIYSLPHAYAYAMPTMKNPIVTTTKMMSCINCLYLSKQLDSSSFHCGSGLRCFRHRWSSYVPNS